MVTSRSTRSWRWIRLAFRLPWLRYSNWVRRSLYNLEVLFMSGWCVPTNRYAELTDLTQFCHGLCEQFSWDSISEALKTITWSLNLICSHTANSTHRTLSILP
jgi:hypothetical protein